MRWHRVRTSDGWEIRDENGLLVASLFNPQHDREDDARLIAEAPATRERLHRIEPPVEAVRAQLVQEKVAWISSGGFSEGRVHRYHERAWFLAQRLGIKRDTLFAELEREALAIIEKGD